MFEIIINLIKGALSLFLISVIIVGVQIIFQKLFIYINDRNDRKRR